MTDRRLPNATETSNVDKSPYRGPCEIATHPNGKTLYVTEKDARCIAILDVTGEQPIERISLPATPTGLCLGPNSRNLYVTCTGPAGYVCTIDTASKTLVETITAGHGARGPCISPDARLLYVCNQFEDDVTVIDLLEKVEIARVACSREPFDAAITPDGRTVFVSNRVAADRSDSYDVASEVTTIDPETRTAKPIRLCNGTVCMSHICMSPDGEFAFAVAKLARYQMPTTGVERGWMNTNAMVIINARERKYVNTVLLDDPDLGAADPYDIATTTDGRVLCITHAGSHQLSVINIQKLVERLRLLPSDENARNELISQERLSDGSLSSRMALDVPNDLAFLSGLRRRVSLPGKGPRGVGVMGRDVYCAMFFSDRIARVADIATLDATQPDNERRVAVWPKTTGIALGPAPSPTEQRKGEMLFHDASECFQNWQSCASCHPDGRMDSLNWDLLDDGLGNPKNTKSLVLAHATVPSLARGQHADLDMAIRNRFKRQLFNTLPEQAEQVQWMAAYLGSLRPTTNPRLSDTKQIEKAAAGRGSGTRKNFAATGHGLTRYTSIRKPIRRGFPIRRGTVRVTTSRTWTIRLNLVSTGLTETS